MSLPFDILVDIGLRLEVSDYFHFALVCKAWAEVVRSSDFRLGACAAMDVDPSLPSAEMNVAFRIACEMHKKWRDATLSDGQVFTIHPSMFLDVHEHTVGYCIVMSRQAEYCYRSVLEPRGSPGPMKNVITPDDIRLLPGTFCLLQQQGSFFLGNTADESVTQVTPRSRCSLCSAPRSTTSTRCCAGPPATGP